MGSDIIYLITLLNVDDKELYRVVLKINRDELDGDTAAYPMEPENRVLIHALLPEHIQTLGVIVEIDAGLIFDVCVKEE